MHSVTNNIKDINKIKNNAAKFTQAICNKGRYKPSETSSGLLEEVIGQKREVFISVNFLFNSHQKYLVGSETSLSQNTTQPFQRAHLHYSLFIRVNK